AIILAVLVIWQGLAVSGWLYRDVVPRLEVIAGALWTLLSTPDYYWHLGATAYEVAWGLAIGGTLGLAVGLALGANRLMAREGARVRGLSLLSRPDAEDLLFPGDDHVVRRRPRLEGGDGGDLLLLPDRAVDRRWHAPDRPGADPRRPQLPPQHLADGDEDLS